MYIYIYIYTLYVYCISLSLSYISLSICMFFCSPPHFGPTEAARLLLRLRAFFWPAANAGAPGLGFGNILYCSIVYYTVLYCTIL